MLHNRSHHSETACRPQLERSPCALKLEKNLHSNQDPAQPVNKWNYKRRKKSISWTSLKSKTKKKKKTPLKSLLLSTEFDSSIVSLHTYKRAGEGSGNPLQYSCLENPWMEEPGGLQSMGSLGVGRTEQLHFHFSLSCNGEGNGNPLQCSCLENPREGGAWWAAVYGVAQSGTRLKWLSSSSSIKGPEIIALEYCMNNFRFNIAKMAYRLVQF